LLLLDADPLGPNGEHPADRGRGCGTTAELLSNCSNRSAAAAQPHEVELLSLPPAVSVT
jgi:hypothetical protein